MLRLWAAITADGRSPLVFIDRGIKINAEYYRENILEGAVKPWVRKHFCHRPWTFQQDQNTNVSITSRKRFAAKCVTVSLAV